MKNSTKKKKEKKNLLFDKGICKSIVSVMNIRGQTVIS